MAYSQKLPTYIKEFENAPWLKKESDHYVFHYFKDSLAEKEIEIIAEVQEKAFEKITSVLGIQDPQRKIKYYIYPDGETKKKLMGDDWYAQSIYNEFCIHTTYNEKDKVIGPHEDTHLLTLPWGRAIGFFQEGLAEYMVGHDWYGNSHDKRAGEALKKDILPPVETMFAHQAWIDTSDEDAINFYAYTGSFVTWLIQSFGIEKFKEFYKKIDRENTGDKNIRIFVDTYSLKPIEAETSWKNKILSL